MIDIKKADKELQLWWEERPQHIKDLINKYPYGFYSVKDKAPYSITAPGSIVAIASHIENGNVRIVVIQASEEANINTLLRSIEHGKKIEVADGLSAIVDPQWLELIEVDPLYPIHKIIIVVMISMLKLKKRIVQLSIW